MTGLLHLDSAADRSGGSVSRRLTALFARTWRSVHGASGYRYRDLVADPVPPLDSGYCALGRRLERRGLVPPSAVADAAVGPDEAAQWAATLPLIEELLAADTVLIGAPMYNFSVPAALKAWIDRVGFPGAFVDPDTGRSLLRATRLVVVATRGGAYGPGTPREAWDFQIPWLRAFFGDRGVTAEHMHFVTAEMTMAELVPHLERFRPLAEDSLEAARAAVVALASARAEDEPGVRVDAPGR
ncbi:NAD(P)H-dependent oxidoreductase [Yinghuangia sp. ASG 101]|uniref:FMN-dependent NADH-azoreductase n=1 Tax=Yinghuangia sp. ASG 101 TaxID=2896848 RepID=UPI001E4EF575|nr:NAD(P)H-dependent oxidoreductase [Yinghuangia sp. ASG 101]UGQ12745.1 NAD(P)H-dependent oxidoreductase [Yinghuangia sp. ASG 101]